MIAHSHDEEFRLSAQLGAAGRYGAALRLLDSVPADERNPEMKSLRAKILSQQGDFAQAAEAWREVLAQSPDDAEARRGLELAERFQARPAWTAPPRVRLLLAGVLIAVLATGFWGAYAAGRSAGIAAASGRELVQQTQTQQLQTANQLVDALTLVLAEGKDQDAALARAHEDRLAALAARFEAIGQTLDGLETQQQAADARCEAALASLSDRPADPATAPAIDALRRDLAAALELGHQFQRLRDSYERLALRSGHVSPDEHRRMREELERLGRRTDALLERVAQLVFGGETAHGDEE